MEPAVSPSDHATVGWMVWSLIEHVKALSAKMGNAGLASGRAYISSMRANPIEQECKHPCDRGSTLSIERLAVYITLRRAERLPKQLVAVPRLELPATVGFV